MRGWLGPYDAQEWWDIAHSETVIPCHTKVDTVGDAHQCAGSYIYRANMCKRPRPGSGILVLPSDRERVFATHLQFLEHHAASQPLEEDALED